MNNSVKLSGEGVVALAFFVLVCMVAVGQLLSDNDALRREKQVLESSGLILAQRVVRVESELEASQERELELIQQAAMYAVFDPQMGITTEEMDELVKLIPRGNPFFGKWRVTSSFGSDSGFGGNPRTKHMGIDLIPANLRDWRIRSYAPGTSTTLGTGSAEGLNCTIEHNERVRSRYWHLEKAYYAAEVGNELDIETVLGVMGSTGYSDRAHLHFQLEVFANERWWPIDPYPFMEGEHGI